MMKYSHRVSDGVHVLKMCIRDRFSYQPLFYVCTLAILGAGLVSWLMIEKNHRQAEYY